MATVKFHSSYISAIQYATQEILNIKGLTVSSLSTAPGKVYSCYPESVIRPGRAFLIVLSLSQLSGGRRNSSSERKTVNQGHPAYRDQGTELSQHSQL